MDISDRIKEIPHLKLPAMVDVAALSAEIFSVQHNLMPFRVDAGNRDLVSGFGNLNVTGLVDVAANPNYASVHLPILAKADPTLAKVRESCIPTDLGSVMPQTLAAIRSIGETPARCKLSCLPAGASVPGHTHHHVTGYDEQIVHIALTTHPAVDMIIRRGRIEFRQHYAPGEVWLFNNWHEHAVENNSPEDRYHLWLNYYLKDDKGQKINLRLWDLIERALEAVDAEG